jgi:hypothetical protein
MPSLRLIVPVFLICAIASAEPAPVSATVLDATTLEPVAGARITIGQRQLVTDDAGQVELGELPGAIAIVVEAEGYERATDTLGPDAPAVVLLFRPDAAGEVIEMSDAAPPASAAASTLLSRDEIRGLPGGGEDALAAVRSMPGIGQAPPTAGGRLVIRGAAPEDTRLTIDGISVPFLYHSFNNTTILPVSTIAGIEYTPGAFGVEEGRATGGVVALVTDDTTPQRPAGEVAVSLLEVAAHAAAPIARARGLAISGGLRRSTVDLLAPLAVPDDAKIGFVTAPRFYDGELRLDWRPSARDKLAVLGILSYDALGVVNNDPASDLPSAFAMDTRFARLIGSWKHDRGRIHNRLAGALGADRWHAEIGLDQNVDGHGRSIALRDDLRVVASDALQLRAGAITELALSTVHALSLLPPTEGLPAGRVDQLPIHKIDGSYDANYAGAYVASDITPTRSTTITTGVRLDAFGHTNQRRILPRAQLRQRLGPVTLAAAFGRYARDPDGTEGIPRDLAPELATQGSLATEVAIASGITTSLAAFASERRDLVVEDPTKTALTDLPYKTGGTGRTRGLELLVRAQRGAWFGWLAYTLSRSVRRDAPLATDRPFAYDQTHLVSAVASWRRGPWQAGARWQLASGLPYTDVVGATYVDEIGHYVPELGPAYAARFPFSHQLDLRLERTWQRRGYRIAVFTDLSNIYRHQRVLRYQYSDDFMSRKPISDLIPLPSLGVRGEF